MFWCIAMRKDVCNMLQNKSAMVPSAYSVFSDYIMCHLSNVIL